MTDQPELPFGRIPPFQRHSKTSREAALRIYPRAGTLRLRVLSYLQGRGEDGATDDETQEALGMNQSTQRPRRIELETGGFVAKAGVKRKTRSGCWAEVYVARVMAESVGRAGSKT